MRTSKTVTIKLSTPPTQITERIPDETPTQLPVFNLQP